MKIRRGFPQLLSERGFTLVETMFFAILFPVLMLAMYSVLSLANTIFQTNTIYSQLNMNAMQTARYVAREIGETSPNTLPSHLNITTDGSGNSIVRFQIPVDWDNDGDAVTNDLDPDYEWGIMTRLMKEETGALAGGRAYSVTNGQLIRDVLDSGLAVVADKSKTIANNVITFTATQSSSNLRLSVTLRSTDTVGQSGGQRQVQTSFTTNTILRNAVN